MPCYREDDGVEGRPRVRPDRARPDAEAGLDVREGVRPGDGGAAPALVTAEYKIAKRPEGRVLVDYNQNAWGRTLASIYSVRPKPMATVSVPVTWSEIDKGVAIEDFRIGQRPRAGREEGRPLEAALGSPRAFRLEKYL